MANTFLQALLGERYHEGMTEDEIAEAIKEAGVGKTPTITTPTTATINVESDEVKRLKELLSKANSEAADYKKQLRTKQSEAEIKEAEEKEEREKLLQQNQELSKKIAIAENSSELLKMGYDGELAITTAEALYNGDLRTVFANQRKFLESREQAIKADLLKSTPKPPIGQGTEGMTIEKFRTMSRADRYKFAQEHPEEYEQLYKES